MVELMGSGRLCNDVGPTGISNRVAYSKHASTLDPAKRSIPVVSYRPTTGDEH